MPRKLRLAYFAHTLQSDWNNGNAHFLRGLLRALGQAGHAVTAYEPENEWSVENLRQEELGARSLLQFSTTYPDLAIVPYRQDCESAEDCFRTRLRDVDVVFLHEWNPPHLAQMLLALREELGFRLLFHDTHHRASSSPEQMERFGLTRFDGIVAFGDALRAIYRERFGISRIWTLHEAADTSVFLPLPEIARRNQIIWIGNWGDCERARELREFLLGPATALRELAATTLFGVRYPAEALAEVRTAGLAYGGYLPNLEAPRVYAEAGVTAHIPRQQYAGAMNGIPTIRVFEALACGIPLVSAPWRDTEGLFRKGDFMWADNTAEMTTALRTLLTDRAAAEDQAKHGLETVLTRHTCAHRAKELTAICEEVLG